MKNKLIEKIVLIYNQIETLDKELKKTIKTEEVDKAYILETGTKTLKLQEQTIELLSLVDTYLNIGEFPLEDLPKGAADYYTTFQILKSPSSEKDNEEIKQFKEFINSFKNNGKES